MSGGAQPDHRAERTRQYGRGGSDGPLGLALEQLVLTLSLPTMAPGSDQTYPRGRGGSSPNDTGEAAAGRVPREKLKSAGQHQNYANHQRTLRKYAHPAQRWQPGARL